MTTRPRGNLFIVSSPSGGGKTTLIRRLIADPPGAPLHFSVSHTTRPMRAGERNGREYHFVTDGTFRKMAARKAFLEQNVVHGRRYGTSRAEVLPHLSRGEDVVLDIDVQGARDIRKVYPRAVSIFIVLPNLAELERRLRRRGLDRDEEIRRRLRAARVEIRKARQFQYVIVNDDLDRATLELQSLVRATRVTYARQRTCLDRVFREFR
ncbi:MAG: guanylate kinase [Acidobacteria bacterium]|nr:MAG: guanylate kinase [Acidobacteriota bacterium]PYQ68073.1 MAG: guanylate kinase [Acidobacteriota bacterium]